MNTCSILTSHAKKVKLRSYGIDCETDELLERKKALQHFSTLGSCAKSDSLVCGLHTTEACELPTIVAMPNNLQVVGVMGQNIARVDDFHMVYRGTVELNYVHSSSPITFALFASSVDVPNDLGNGNVIYLNVAGTSVLTSFTRIGTTKQFNIVITFTANTFIFAAAYRMSGTVSVTDGLTTFYVPYTAESTI